MATNPLVWADDAERLAGYRARLLRACARHGAHDVDLHGVVVMGPEGPEPDLMIVIRDQLSDDVLSALRRDLALA